VAASDHRHSEVRVPLTPPHLSIDADHRSMCKDTDGKPPVVKDVVKKLSCLKETKKLMKKVMPFVAVLIEKINQSGAEEALQSTSRFDEEEVLNLNLKYLLDTSNLKLIEVRSSSEGSSKIKDESCPGKPLIELSTIPSITIEVRNQQCLSAYHSIYLPIKDGETCQQVISGIMKNQQSIKNAEVVELFYFSDPTAGPRKIPSIKENLREDLTCVQPNSHFCVDQVKNEVILKQFDGSMINIEKTLVYIVAS